MTKVSVRELRNNLAKYLRKAQAGEQILVTSRGKAVVAISSVQEREKTTEDKLREMEAKGLIRLGKGKYVPPAHPIRLQGEGPSVSEIVLADRGEPIP